jgi:hypothetical protein
MTHRGLEVAFCAVARFRCIACALQFCGAFVHHILKMILLAKQIGPVLADRQDYPRNRTSYPSASRASETILAPSWCNSP